MRKILHLTDLHIGKGNCTAICNSVITNIISLLDGNDYIVVITGDLIDDATIASQLDEAVAQVKRLHDHFGTEHVLIAPGNHDCGTGTNGKSHLMKKFKEAIFNNPHEKFPKTDIVDNIAFIGLDSMAKEMDGLDGFGAEGELGKTQRDDLKDILANDPEVNSCDYRVVYLHHRPVKFNLPGLLLKDHAELKTVVRGKIDMLLFGHEHEADYWHNESQWRIKRMYNAGMSTRNPQKGPHRIIDLAGEPASDIDGSFYPTA